VGRLRPARSPTSITLRRIRPSPVRLQLAGNNKSLEPDESRQGGQVDGDDPSHMLGVAPRDAKDEVEAARDAVAASYRMQPPHGALERLDALGSLRRESRSDECLQPDAESFWGDIGAISTHQAVALKAPHTLPEAPPRQPDVSEEAVVSKAPIDLEGSQDPTVPSVHSRARAVSHGEHTPWGRPTRRVSRPRVVRADGADSRSLIQGSLACRPARTRYTGDTHSIFFGY
jgi:hypothetical protein